MPRLWGIAPIVQTRIKVNNMAKKSMRATLHSASDAVHTKEKPEAKKGVLSFDPIDDDENYWSVMPDADSFRFLREVWPYMNMGDLCKMRTTQAYQVMWSAYGYGVTVYVKGDPRW